MLPHHEHVAARASRTGDAIHFSPLLAELTRVEKGDVFVRMKTSPVGLSEAEAESRLADAGPNLIAEDKHRGWFWHLLTAIRNPLVILLIVLAAISFGTGDAHAGTVMALMVVLGMLLRFVQEARANTAAAKLKAMITVTATVLRAGSPKRFRSNNCPRRRCKLSAGDMVPADARIIAAKDLFVSRRR